MTNRLRNGDHDRRRRHRGGRDGRPLLDPARSPTKRTIHASTKFATAPREQRPERRPRRAATDFVKGVRAYFGGVSSATRVIDSHNHSVNTGDSADTRSYYVGDILLATKLPGPAVIELEFDNQSLANSSEKISSIHELAHGARSASTS